MATFSELQTKVSRRLLDANNTAVSSEDVADAINDSVRYWKYRRFWFNQGSMSETVTAQSAIIPLPSDFLVPVIQDAGFYIEYSELRYVLRKLDIEPYTEAWQGNGFGIPRSYVRIDNRYEMYPIPDRDYTIKGQYLKEYPPLVNDTDTNDFTDNADRLLVLWTCANLSGELRQDEKMEAYFRAAADDYFRQLQIMTDKSNAAGSLVVSSTIL